MGSCIVSPIQPCARVVVFACLVHTQSRTHGMNQAPQRVGGMDVLHTQPCVHRQVERFPLFHILPCTH